MTKKEQKTLIADAKSWKKLAETSMSTQSRINFLTKASNAFQTAGDLTAASLCQTEISNLNMPKVK